MTRWVALMPLRGGSTSIPGKNIRLLAGRPLFAWSLEQAQVSECFDQLFVATDSDAIRAAVASHFPSGVTVIDRGPDTATDTASTESVLLEFQRRFPFDVLGLVQATSPLTLASDFRAARRRFESDALDSLLSAVEFRRFLWQPDGTPLNYDPVLRPRRQDIPPALMENGAFYLTRAATLAQLHNRLGGRIGIHIMAPDTDVELDEPGDWDIAEMRLLRRLQGRRVAQAAAMRALVLDVDGTLTDGGMFYGAGGEQLKRFCTRDGKGLELIRTRGLRVCVITGEDSPAVAARMRKLKIDDYFPGVDDKLAVLQRWASAAGIAMEHIAFMGDDLGDLPCLQNTGLAICPADAVPEVRACADHVCSHNGGHGAVREACDWLLDPGALQPWERRATGGISSSGSAMPYA